MPQRWMSSLRPACLNEGCPRRFPTLICVWACSGSRQMESCLSTWHMQRYHCLHPWLISVICNQLRISILLQIKNILEGKEGQNTCVQVREWEPQFKRICLWKHCLWLLLRYLQVQLLFFLLFFSLKKKGARTIIIQIVHLIQFIVKRASLSVIPSRCVACCRRMANKAAFVLHAVKMLSE